MSNNNDLLDLALGTQSSPGMDIAKSFISGYNQPSSPPPQMSGLDPRAQLMIATRMQQTDNGIGNRIAGSIMTGISTSLDSLQKKQSKETISKLIDSGKARISIKDGKFVIDTVDEAQALKDKLANEKTVLDMKLSALEQARKERETGTKESDAQNNQLALAGLTDAGTTIDAINRINEVRIAKGLPPVSRGSAMVGQQQAARKLEQGESTYNRLADIINTQKGRKLIEKVGGEAEMKPIFTIDPKTGKPVQIGSIPKGAGIVSQKSGNAFDQMVQEALGGSTQGNKSAPDRYNELKKTGMADDVIYKQLAQEGY